ncbi:MAG: hypothetical protein AAB681_01560 [Patescibacteria group bacterium]
MDQEINKITPPSRRFLIRGGVATGIIAIVLVAQTSWFQNIFSKNGTKGIKVDPNMTVGDLVTKDSNGNSIPDWQERLWGLDPTVATTNGVSNKTIIEEKRKSLGGANDQTGPLNETDILAQQLYGATTALGQTGFISSDNFASIGSNLGKTIELKQATNHYSIKDIGTVKTTASSLKSYFNTMSDIVAKYGDDSAEIDIIVSALESGDYSRMSELSQKAIKYKALSKSLQIIKVPVGVADFHLSIINGLYGIAESFNYIAEAEDNGINALAGIGIYKTYALRTDLALINMHDYLLDYGIILQ